MDHLSDDSKIHVRLPLDDVLVGRCLEGRLASLIAGIYSTISWFDLQLDGQAHEFIAGIKTIFELRDERLQTARCWNAGSQSLGLAN